MKKYSVKLLALLLIVLLSVIGMAGAADTCAHSYTLHGGRICSKCFSVKAGAGCSMYYSHINGTKTHKVYCGTAGHGSELIRQENCIYTSGYYSVSDGKAQKVCNLCHDEQWHAKGSVREVSSNQAIFLDADTHLVDNLDCDKCGVMYTARRHDYKLLDKHGVYVCSDCNTDKDGKEHDKDATSWLVCHGCNGCTNCDGLYLLHGNRICDKCHSVKADAQCDLMYVYIETAQEHDIYCVNPAHNSQYELITREQCATANGYYRIKDGVPATICDLCHNNDGQHLDGTITEGESNTIATLPDGTHLVNSLKCTTCDDIFTTLAHECKENAAHAVPICEVCYLDADENQHDPTAVTPEDCEVCAEIIAEREPVCKHTTLINRYFTWVDAKQHRESSVCKDCGEAVESTGYHGTSASWHNGTVCLYCRTDENGVKHNWYSGECTVCPKPIPDGLNPDDGWYYEGGEKSDFTGLAEYNDSLFYVENGQWQKELDGLKMIGEEFWYLAGGQVQEHHGFAEYDGEWFYLDGGKLDVTASGVYGYDGKTFLVAAGRLVSECTGLAQVPSGEWYYVAEGRVLTEFSGEVEYDGKTFQIVNGKLAA